MTDSDKERLAQIAAVVLMALSGYTIANYNGVITGVLLGVGYFSVWPWIAEKQRTPKRHTTTGETVRLD